MAAVTKVKPVMISLPGDTWIDRGYANEDFEAGDLVVVASTPHPNPEFDMALDLADGTDAAGIVLQDCGAGGLVSFAKVAEIAGYTGLTPNARLTIVAGVLDNTAPAANANYAARARNETTIWFSVL